MEPAEAHGVRAPTGGSAPHGSEVRSLHEFFGEVCDALDCIDEAPVTGSHAVISEFPRLRRDAPSANRSAHRRHEVTDHPSESQLIALARKCSLKHDRMAGAAMQT
jgi:hypothetical protein